jgi:hypothetical protein
MDIAPRAKRSAASGRRNAPTSPSLPPRPVTIHGPAQPTSISGSRERPVGTSHRPTAPVERAGAIECSTAHSPSLPMSLMAMWGPRDTIFSSPVQIWSPHSAALNKREGDSQNATQPHRHKQRDSRGLRDTGEAGVQLDAAKQGGATILGDAAIHTHALVSRCRGPWWYLEHEDLVDGEHKVLVHVLFCCWCRHRCGLHMCAGHADSAMMLGMWRESFLNKTHDFARAHGVSKQRASDPAQRLREGRHPAAHAARGASQFPTQTLEGFRYEGTSDYDEASHMRNRDGGVASSPGAGQLATASQPAQVPPPPPTPHTTRSQAPAQLQRERHMRNSIESN